MHRLRVLTLNIWNRQGPWEQRLELIRRGIRDLDPDIVGLQEVIQWGDRTQADDIREGLPYESAFGSVYDLGGGAMFGNAVLSRWPIASRHVTALPTGGTDEKRCLLLTEIDSPYGKIPFFVTHLNWKFHEGAVRELQVEAIAERITLDAPEGGLPPILVGDLNAQPEATEIRFLKGLHALRGKSFYMDDCFEHSGTGAGFTFHAGRNPHAACTNEYPRRIDYVLVRGPDALARGKPISSRVVFEEIVDGSCASDHYGVLAEISI